MRNSLYAGAHFQEQLERITMPISDYKKIIAALGRTLDLMQDIDKAVPCWPMQ